MKILVVTKKTCHWPFEVFAKRSGASVKILVPSFKSFFRDFREAFRFYPDMIWIDEEPCRFLVTRWILAKQCFMPWSRVVSSSHDNFFRQFPKPYRAIEKFNYENLTAILSSGKTVTDNLLRKGYGGKLLELVGASCLKPPAPVTESAQDPKNLRESLGLQFKVVGYLGPLVPEKGLEWLMRVLAKLPLNVSLLFVGTGPDEFRLKQLAQELGLESRLKIIPEEGKSVFSKYYRAMDVLVIPSLSTQKPRESFNEFILDAMRAGLPIIASWSGEIPNELGDSGVLVPELDEKALSEAVTKVLKDEAFRSELIQKGKARAGDFDPERMLDKIAEFFSTILR